MKSRKCYCGRWDPLALREQGVPEGFCGLCETCGSPGHTRHFPGALAYTGSWCDRHYQRLSLFHPRAGGAVILVVVAVVVGVAVSFLFGPGQSRDASSCEGRGTAVVIRLKNRTLHLCEAGLAVAEYRVATGRGGIGKRKEGDNKTPIGVYELGEPRGSSRFGVFIPIGYPTAAQRRNGYTGSAIGIHGPSRSLAWAGWVNTAADWTEGCVAVVSDKEISEIAAWVRDNDPSVVSFWATNPVYR